MEQKETLAASGVSMGEEAHTIAEGWGMWWREWGKWF